MAEILLLEMGLACVLAAVLGYILSQRKGAGILGGITLAINALTLLAVLPVVARSNSLARPEFVMLEIAVWAYVLGGFLGYFLSKMMGTLLVQVFAMLTALVCIYSAVLLGGLNEWLAALGLLVVMILIGTIGARFFSKAILRGQGAKPVGILWLGFCATCLIGYWVAGRLGTFTITLPTLLIFWGFLYYLSRFILPLQNDQRSQAFRSLITFTLGTNYSYYVIEDWRNQENCEQQTPDPRVPGNAFNQFLAGPGIILNDANHVAVTTTGFKLRVIPPGLSFTEKYEELYAVVDLRPQLRIHKGIKTETKDGITVSTLTFMPHRIGADGRQPALGKSYPYNEDDVLKAVFREGVIEHKWARDDEEQATEDISKTLWDELVLIMGPPILKDIILDYKCNELHMPEGPRPRDPRVEIVKAFKSRMKEAMKPFGIEMVGGGISNIVPPDEVVEQRIRNWEAKWKRQIEVELGEIKAEKIRQSASVWTEGQLQMMDTISRMLERDDLEISEEALVFQLLDALTKEDPSEPSPEPISETSLIAGMRRGR